MHNNSVGQSIKMPKSPPTKPKHSRDDSSLDKSSKLKAVQSCRRITTQQSGKIYSRFNDTVLKKNNDPKSPKSNLKLNNQLQSFSLLKTNKHSSCKNLKNLKLSSSVNKKIQNYLHFFSPKNKQLINKNSSKQAFIKDLSTNVHQKNGLKKVAGNKTNLINKNKSGQQEIISPFVPFPNNDDKLIKSSNGMKNIKKQGLTKIKQQKFIVRPQGQQKNKNLKTLQNEQIDFYKQRNSNKGQVSKYKKIQRQKMYHNMKMKTQQSMISCQSTPSQLIFHDIYFLQLIGEGTFGKVYKGIIKKTSQIVAIKKVYQDKKYKNRQVQIVQLLNNSNFIMKVLGTYLTYEGNSTNHKQYLNIVMKYYQSDLYKDIQTKKTLTNIQIKIYTYQIFRGLLYIHSKHICHRDVKPHNILTNNMSLAICDFGSAKILNPQQKNLPYICSRCYRAPQLIFGSTQYTTMIDIWSAGCVVLQMIHGSPFFIGNSSIDHLIQVIKVLGTPTKTQVKQMNPQYDLKDYKFPNIKSKSFSKIFPKIDPLLVNLLEQIMIYAPKQRLNAAQVLVHQYFDQLRQQSTYQKLLEKYDLADFFDFTPEQMKQNQHLYGQLVPEWYSKNHQTYFEDQEIQKNNTLKFYFD